VSRRLGQHWILLLTAKPLLLNAAAGGEGVKQEDQVGCRIMVMDSIRPTRTHVEGGAVAASSVAASSLPPDSYVNTIWDGRKFLVPYSSSNIRWIRSKL
jgi:hypothetical protein